MSRALLKPAADRTANYLAQNGRDHLTPAQRRRIKAKANQALRPHARTGRLRRRFDAKDVRQVKAAARRAVEVVRMRKGILR